LFEAVGQQQRSRKLQMLVCSTMLHSSIAA
jgi:hypothetical protein